MRFTPVLLRTIFFFIIYKVIAFQTGLESILQCHRMKKMSCLHHCLINNIIIILNVLSNLIRPETCLYLSPFEFCHLAENQPEYHNQ